MVITALVMVSLSPPEWTTAVIRDQVRDHDVASQAILCPKEPAPIIGPFRAWKPPIPYKRAGVATS